MEIKQRMSKRWAWVLGLGSLVSIGLLVACGSNYNSSSDGLVLIGSQGSALIETFSFNLANGHIAEVSNPPSSTSNTTCALPGLPSNMVINPAGNFAYAILTATDLCMGSQTGIMSFKVNSDGSTTTGTLVSMNPANVGVCQAGGITPVLESVPVVPVALAMDSTGKFLFASNSSTVDTVGNPVPGSVSAFAIGSDGTLTEVSSGDTTTSSPFTVPPNCATRVANFASLAVSPTVFPTQNAVCSEPGQNPPTSEYLYATDSLNNLLYEFAVDPSSGALGNPPAHTNFPFFPTAAVPSGVAVDSCNRFVYVSNLQSNQISAFKICNGSTTQSQFCLNGDDGTLLPITGSPFSLSANANGPGPLVVDPFGNNLYVLETLSDQVSVFRISPVSGSLTAGNPAVVSTGLQPTAMAVRGDGQWLFVANFNSATLSQYSIVPATGVLSTLPLIDTDNYPWGVAVK
jgi:6-phosphogluconolactonase (cycloisomerase 2 family)